MATPGVNSSTRVESSSPGNILSEIWDLLSPMMIVKMILAILASALLAAIGLAISPLAVPVCMMIVHLQHDAARQLQPHI
jgi:hypothetical protein